MRSHQGPNLARQPLAKHTARTSQRICCSGRRLPFPLGKTGCQLPEVAHDISSQVTHSSPLHGAAAARGIIPRQPFSHNRQVRQACISKCNHCCTGRNFKQQRLLRLAPPSATARSRSECSGNGGTLQHVPHSLSVPGGGWPSRRRHKWTLPADSGARGPPRLAPGAGRPTTRSPWSEAPPGLGAAGQRVT